MAMPLMPPFVGVRLAGSCSLWRHFTLRTAIHKFCRKLQLELNSGGLRRMSLDRIAKLVRLAAASSDIVSALRNHPAKLRTPLGLRADHVRVLQRASVFPLPQKASSISGKEQATQTNGESKTTVASRSVTSRAATKDDLTAPVANDGLLPPEGSGQPPEPVLTNLPPLPSPAPQPAPAPAPASPAPVGSPVSQPAPAASPTASAPAPTPLRAPSPLGPFPWQNIPTRVPVGRLPLYPLPTIPVLRQAQPAPSMTEPSYGAPIPVSENPPSVQEHIPMQTAPNQAAVFRPPNSSEGCDCSPYVTALVATVTTTSQTAITAITAIATLR